MDDEILLDEILGSYSGYSFGLRYSCYAITFKVVKNIMWEDELTGKHVPLKVYNIFFKNWEEKEEDSGEIRMWHQFLGKHFIQYYYRSEWFID